MKILVIIFTLVSFRALSQSNPVVIELFTSQGCSSCPAADKNLAELIDFYEKKGLPVYGLSFHVDYWNYIGWKDPYSNTKFTARQRAYSSFMKSESIYTPQMIVNGETEFAGSNRKASEVAITGELKKRIEYHISLNSIHQKDGKVFATYSLDNVPDNLTMQAALVEKKIENEVTRGENSGRTLAHRNVVRSFTSVEAKKNGNLEIEFPRGLSSCSLIVFVQDSRWHIKGAVVAAIQ